MLTGDWIRNKKNETGFSTSKFGMMKTILQRSSVPEHRIATSPRFQELHFSFLFPLSLKTLPRLLHSRTRSHCHSESCSCSSLIDTYRHRGHFVLHMMSENRLKKTFLQFLQHHLPRGDNESRISRDPIFVIADLCDYRMYLRGLPAS